MNETDKKLDYFIINILCVICVIHVTDMKYYLSKLNTYENIIQFICILESQVVECSMGAFIHKDSRS